MKVILISATTVCGRISPGGQASRLDRRRLEVLRDRTQASIMGANTLRVDNPEMRCTNNILPSGRIRAIISQSGSVPVSGKNLFSHGPRPVVFTSEDKTPSLRNMLRGRAEVVSLPAGQLGLSLRAALGFLAARDVESVLIEGGGRLNYSFLLEGLVDEIVLTLIPFVSGDSEASSLADGPHQLGYPLMGLELLECEPLESGEVFLHYRTKK